MSRRPKGTTRAELTAAWRDLYASGKLHDEATRPGVVLLVDSQGKTRLDGSELTPDEVAELKRTHRIIRITIIPPPLWLERLDNGGWWATGPEKFGPGREVPEAELPELAKEYTIRGHPDYPDTP